MTDVDVDALVADADNGIMHNRRKLAAVVNNARICLDIEKEHPGGLAKYLWGFTNHTPVVNETVWVEGSRLPVESVTSKALAVALKAKGFKFLGSITLHAFCQQTGIINDHCRQCFKNPLGPLPNGESTK